MADKQARIENITTADLVRIQAVLHDAGGPSVSWGAASVLEVWIAEARLEADRLAAQAILIATWVLAAATIALVPATTGLIVVALTN